MTPATTVLKNKNIIGSEIAIFPRKESTEYEWTTEEMNNAMDKYAAQNAVAFVKWRTDQSIVMSHRYKLDLTFEEQYKLFIKENGL